MDSVFGSAGTVANRSIIIEPPYKITADDTAKGRSVRTSGEGDNKTTGQTKRDIKTDPKVGPMVVPDGKVSENHSDSKADAKAVTSNSDANGTPKISVTTIPNPEVCENEPIKVESNTTLKENLEVLDKSTSNSKVSEPVLDNITQKNFNVKQSKNADKGSARPMSVPSKQQDERKPGTQPQTSMHVLEENIVLGVALEGSKRTLPIEEGMDSTTTREAKEMAASHGGNRSSMAEDGKDR